MSTQTLETIAIAVAVIVFITIRQSTWQPVNLARLLRMPVIFGVFGLISLSSSLKSLGSSWHPGVMDAAVIGAELALGVLAGWLMGRFTQIQRFGEVLKSKLAPLGVGIWVGFIAVRIGLAALAHVLNAELAAQTGTILIVVAVIKVVQALIVRERIARHNAAERQRSCASAGF